jgi:hypothetical protein
MIIMQIVLNSIIIKVFNVHQDCTNGTQCLQDYPNCPSAIICVCEECFFGNQCQFYAKGFDLTLDEILSYETKSNVFLSEQPFTVKLGAIITMIMFIVAIINGIFSILTFKNKILQEVGCEMCLSHFIYSIIKREKRMSRSRNE